MIRLLKEPLLHFLLIGAGFFALYLYLNPASLESDRRIVVEPGRIEQLAVNFRKTWQRSPSQEELQGLVDNYIVEEVLYRQALELGIDKNDTVIRRRLRQKMEFYTDDVAELTEPAPQELQQYLTENAARYQQPAVFAFEQVFIHTSRPDKQLKARLDTVAERLAAGQSVTGDSGMIPTRFEAASSRELDRAFGSGFADALIQAPANTWSGPVRSGLGMHFVYISAYQPAFTPALEDVAAAVERDWRHARNAALRQSMHDKLLEDYDVVVRWNDVEVPSS
ncbi:peptidyl-prolyl cis-trans isomerase [Marinobacter fonticola]|uniref:peptidylprolyl isomerase n=1 Tax=Marinobacter fonticola TaxID=2603215 RepID=UPI0011E7E9B4|nr:peptidylprolyl isomerase [Marinobacter fonticola]